MNSSIAILQGFFDSLETPVSWKLMAALTFYYYSAEYKKIQRIAWENFIWRDLAFYGGT